MAPKTGATRGKKKTQVAKTKAMEKKKSCLTPGSRRKKQVSTSVKAGLHFPVGRIGRYLKEGQYSQRIGFGAPVYLAAVLKYLPTNVLELVGLAAKDSKKIRIIPRHVMLGVMHDEELSKLLVGVTIAHSGVLPSIHESLLGNGTAEDATKLPAKEAAKSPEKTAESP